MTRESPVPTGTSIEAVVREIRGHRVILDSDVAALYDVPTKALVQAVKRNLPRFPADFMLHLTAEEWAHLRSQTVTSKGRGGRRYAPFAFTEQGVAMLSTVLHSERAIQVNIEIMRTFVRLRQGLASNADLARRLNALEAKYDQRFRTVFTAIRILMQNDAKIQAKLSKRAESPQRRRIGFGKQ